MVVQGDAPPEQEFFPQEYVEEYFMGPQGYPPGLREQEHFHHEDVIGGRGALPQLEVEPMAPLDPPLAPADPNDPYWAGLNARVAERNRANVVNQLLSAGRMLGIIPATPRWVQPAIAGAQQVAAHLGYGDEATAVARFVTRAHPEVIPLVGAAATGFTWLYQNAQRQRDYAAMKKLEAIAAKYPRVTGRTDFASAGNAQSQVS